MKRVNPFKGCVTGGRLEGKLESYLDYKGSFFPPIIFRLLLTK